MLYTISKGFCKMIDKPNTRWNMPITNRNWKNKLISKLYFLCIIVRFIKIKLNHKDHDIITVKYITLARFSFGIVSMIFDNWNMVTVNRKWIIKRDSLIKRIFLSMKNERVKQIIIIKRHPIEIMKVALGIVFFFLLATSIWLNEKLTIMNIIQYLNYLIFLISSWVSYCFVLSFWFSSVSLSFDIGKTDSDCVTSDLSSLFSSSKLILLSWFE